MKKMMVMVLATLLICSVRFAASATCVIAQPPESLVSIKKIVSILDLTDEELNEVMNGQHPEVAVEFPSHLILPFNFVLKGDLINLIDKESRDLMQIRIKQTFYICCVQKQLLFSSNLSEWKSLQEFITGTASGTLDIQQFQRPSITIGAEIYLRQ